MRARTYKFTSQQLNEKFPEYTIWTTKGIAEYVDVAMLKNHKTTLARLTERINIKNVLRRNYTSGPPQFTTSILADLYQRERGCAITKATREERAQWVYQKSEAPAETEITKSVEKSIRQRCLSESAATPPNKMTLAAQRFIEKNPDWTVRTPEEIVAFVDAEMAKGAEYRDVVQKLRGSRILRSNYLRGDPNYSESHFLMVYKKVKGVCPSGKPLKKKVKRTITKRARRTNSGNGTPPLNAVSVLKVCIRDNGTALINMTVTGKTNDPYIRLLVGQKFPDLELS